VLVVDDDKTLAQMISVRLRGAGFAVLTAFDAEDASVMAVHHRPDVVVLDIQMPHFTGIELHQCLQYAERSRGIPVIYLTGQDTESVRLAACELGACAVITKPFDSTKLIAAIKRAVSKEAVVER
jgi:two-component system alkaline phosphatase synthesis response regulator PhoP